MTPEQIAAIAQSKLSAGVNVRAAAAGAFGVRGTPLEAWQRSRALAAVPSVSLAELIPQPARVIVIAPHPDDEVLACGGLLAALAERGTAVTLVSVTDGEGSHPDSPLWPPEILGSMRRQESRSAMQLLGFPLDQLDWQYLGLPDGSVAAHATALESCLRSLVRPGDCLLTTWRGDGHCDHEAVGEVAAACAQHAGAQLIEAPVWAWHWAAPEDPRLPWARACKWMLDEQQLARKRLAVAAHVSQWQSDPTTQAGAVLDKATLARLLQPYELFFT